MLKKYKDLYKFDEITQFRLINTFLFAISFNLILPVLMDLRGELLTSTLITFILIVTTLAVKINKYIIENFTLSEIYKLGNFSHILFFSAGFIYYWNQLYFVYADSFFAIVEVAIFSSYTIKLNVYLADNYSDTVGDFHVFRNSIFADGTLIGLFIVWMTSYFSGNTLSVTVFIGYNLIFLAWLLYHWNFFSINMVK